MAFVRAMYKKGTGNDKQRKDAGNRMLCLYRTFSQAIIPRNVKVLMSLQARIIFVVCDASLQG